jgi:hypothetical protein
MRPCPTVPDVVVAEDGAVDVSATFVEAVDDLTI